MEDRQIVELYFARDEAALEETQKKYGRYCHSIAYRILNSDEDSEECVNDTYLGAWQSIPPHRPLRLSTFLGKITRNLALNRYAAQNREKRGTGEVPLALEELQECLPDIGESKIADDAALRDALNRFVLSLPRDVQRVFVRRYWYLESVAQIAREEGVGESRVKMQLARVREKLKQFLEKEGIGL